MGDVLNDDAQTIPGPHFAAHLLFHQSCVAQDPAGGVACFLRGEAVLLLLVRHQIQMRLRQFALEIPLAFVSMPPVRISTFLGRGHMPTGVCDRAGHLLRHFDSSARSWRLARRGEPVILEFAFQIFRRRGFPFRGNPANLCARAGGGRIERSVARPAGTSLVVRWMCLAIWCPWAGPNSSVRRTSMSRVPCSSSTRLDGSFGMRYW